MKTAVFSCLGLGDGLLALVLAKNLQDHGNQVVTFHPFLTQLQNWFPELPICPFPPNLLEFDRFFIIYETSEWMQKVLKQCLADFRDCTTVLNPIATPNQDYPFWEEGRFDGSQTFVDNLVAFCGNILKLDHPTRLNGLTIPDGIALRKYPKRVVIHPTSSRSSKNWTKPQFIELATRLQRQQFEPVFIVSSAEQQQWPEGVVLSSLHEVAKFVCESGAMIGNDSGIGHLASCLGLPTLTLCRNQRTANFWRPAWSPGKVLVPSQWIPNIKGLRWRDQYWQKGISVGRVERNFHTLIGC